MPLKRGVQSMFREKDLTRTGTAPTAIFRIV
jgi:hypothetical protein